MFLGRKSPFEKGAVQNPKSHYFKPFEFFDYTPMDSLTIGKRLKRKMVAATLWCMVPGLLCGLKLSPIMWLLGLVFAFIHANIFEFFFHKAYHDPKFFRFQAHAQHHVTQFRENEAEKVALFSGSPLGIMGLLAFNIFPGCSRRSGLRSSWASEST
jgi:hypothetical protein